MKKTRIAKMLTAATLSAAMVMSMGGMTAFANTSVDSSVKGGSITFTKELVKKSPTATTPAVVFPFTIAAASSAQCAAGVSYNGTPVKEGIGTPTLTFGENNETGVTYTVGDTNLTKSVTITFPNVTFAQPGIYRYLITEGTSEEGTRLGITSETGAMFLDVRVVRQGGTLVIDDYGFIAATKSGDNYVPKDDAKVDGKFTNNYDTYDLVLSKELDGDMAEDDRLFTFEVEFYDGQEDIVLGVDPDGENGTYNVNGLDVAGITFGENGTADPTNTIQITANGTVTIKDIPGCVKYNVNELNPGNGYKEVAYSINSSSDATLSGNSEFSADVEKFGTGEGLTNAKAIDKTVEGANTIVFTNKKDSSDSQLPATGIILNFAPYALLVAFAGVFAVLFLRKRREEF